MEARDDFFGQHDLGVARITAGFALFLELLNFFIASHREQVKPVPHQVIGQGHDFSEHFVRFFGDADVVVFGFAHLVDAVQTDKQRHRNDALGLLVVLTLKLTADQKVETLVGAAEFDIGFKLNRVVSLHQRVDQLVHGNRSLRSKTLGEVVAFKQTGERIAGGEFDEAGRA